MRIAMRRNTPGLDAAPGRVQQGARRLVERLAAEAVARALLRSRVRTGAQRASVYAAIYGGRSDAARAQAAARARRPEARLFPPVVPPAPRGPAGAAAVVACGVEYGIYNDRGHHSWPGDGWWSQTVADMRAMARSTRVELT